MKKKMIILFAVILMIAGMLIFRNCSSASAGNTVYISEVATPRTIQTTISATGSLEPEDEVEVGTQVSGDISKINVDFNDHVKKGQILAELDKSKLQSSLFQAEIAYRSAQNDYSYKKSVYERTQKLVETKSASLVDLESAQYAMNAAKYAMEKSKNEVNQAKINLDYCIIRSPIDGVVLERSVDVGQTVAASMSAPTLFILAKDLTQMKVLASVDEADVGAVKQGQRVEFTVDAFPDDHFEGEVQQVRLNSTVTSNVVTYTVVISAQNPEKKLLPGMTATCTIITQEKENVISVSASALKFNPTSFSPDLKPLPSKNSNKSPLPGLPARSGSPAGREGMPPQERKFATEKREKQAPRGAKVWILREGKIFPQPVKTGLTDGVSTEISEGLSLGDSVVVREEEASKEVKNTSSASSPFMPSPPKRR